MTPSKLDPEDRVRQKWVATGIADRISKLAGTVDRAVLRDLAAKAIAEALGRESQRNGPHKP